jgi:hypothetical protein
VNDTTNNPDRPDRSGTVATGDQQAGQDPAAASGGVAKKDAGNGAGPATPAAKRGEGEPAAADARPDEATRSVPPADADAPAAPAKPAPRPAPKPAGGGLFDEHRVQGADAPTARIRVPPSNGSSARPAAKAAAEAPTARPTPGKAAPAPAQAADAEPDDDAVATRALSKPDAAAGKPAPAAGKPAPAAAGGGSGPAPAAPPPWNRVPGKERAREANGPVVTTDASVGELLQEGPTTYIDVADRGIAPPKPRAGEDEAEGASGSGSWPATRPGRNRPPRQAALQLKRLDPWSVLKLALVLAVVLFFIWLVAVGVLYGVLDGMGVWDKLNGTYSDLVSGESAGGSPLISAGRVLGLAAVVGAINSLLFAVAVTVAAFVYNVSADLVGGIEVTLSERD